MQVNQIYTLLNSVTQEIMGESVIVNEDLSNVVSIGETISGTNNIDNYVKSLINHIGKVVFVSRPYSGSVPSVLMDSWEFGSILEKVSCELPEAKENSEWNLQDGQSYDTGIFYKPKVNAKFFNSKVTFEIPMSFTVKQVTESFSNVNQLNGFYSMLYDSIDKSMTIKIDSLVERCINSMVANTLLSDFPSVTDGNYAGVTGIKAVNLLKLYNDTMGTTLTKDKILTTPEFIRFAIYTINTYKQRLSKISKLFNIGKTDKFTTGDYLNTVILSDLLEASRTYLLADTYHDTKLELTGNISSVPYWQGSGTNYAFNDITKINVKVNTDSGTKSVETNGILAVIFDRDAIGVCNQDKRVTMAYNAKGEFYNNYYKFDCSYYTDLNENFIVFFVA